MKFIIIALALLLSAEEVKKEIPVIGDAEKATLYYKLWQQQSAESRAVNATLALRAACDAVPACAQAAVAEKEAQAELERQKTIVSNALKPYLKEGWDITPKLEYVKKKEAGGHTEK